MYTAKLYAALNFDPYYLKVSWISEEMWYKSCYAFVAKLYVLFIGIFALFWEDTFDECKVYNKC